MNHVQLFSLALSEYENAMNELHDEVQFTLHMRDEVLKLFPPIHVVHLGTTRLVSRPNILDRAFETYSTKVDIDPTMFLGTDVEKFKDVILRWTADLLEQQAKLTVEVMLETGHAAGQSFDAGRRNYWDVYAEMLERLPYQPHGYRMLMNPETEKKLGQTPQTPEQRLRVKGIQQVKREQFLETKRTRRLS